MKALLFAIVMLLGGCAYRPAEELVMDPSLSPEQMAAVVVASDEWCEKAGLCVPVSVGEDRGVGFVTHRKTCWEGVGARTDQGPYRAPTVTLCDDRDGFLSVIATHEIGHALTGDPSHIEEPGHAMSVDNIRAVATVTPEDVDWAYAR